MYFPFHPNWIQGEAPVTLENTAVVDKTVIFMHNVGATQELARRNEKLWEQVQFGVGLGTLAATGWRMEDGGLESAWASHIL